MMIDYDTLPHTQIGQDQGVTGHILVRTGCPIHYWLTGPENGPLIEIWSAVMNCLHPEPGYQITKPLLITHGAEDRLGFGLIREQSRAWASRDPNSHYVVIPQAEHNTQQENPSFFNRVLLDFLAQHELSLLKRNEGF